MSRDSNPDDQAALANGPSITPWPNEQPISIKLANDQNLTHPIHPIKLIILSILSRNILTPMLDLEILKIGSRCDEKYVTFMVRNCLNIRELSFGMNAGISDVAIMKVNNKEASNLAPSAFQVL